MSDDRHFSVNIENGTQQGKERRWGLLARLPKPKVPSREGHRVSDLFKLIACLMAVACICQYKSIQHFKNGIRRVPNDHFDNIFGSHYITDRTSPVIWDSVHQSFLHNVVPAPVHSHNDYWRRLPLFEAIGSGCISVEADVHLHKSDLLVGHTASDLHSSVSLRSLYLDPLERMLKAQNANITDGTWQGIFNSAPQQTFTLLVDHKTEGETTLTELYTQLQPLRDLDYLTYWNGTGRVLRPLTVVASGNAPFQSITALNATHRDIFFDAKLEALLRVGDTFEPDGTPIMYAYNISNSYFASTRYANALLFPWEGQKPYIEQAKARGLISRYWDTPAQPPNLKDSVLDGLVQAGVGILNMDDLGVVRAKANWGWGNMATV